MTIDDIRRMTFAGNHAMDMARFEAISQFILHAAVPMAEKVEALKILESRGMGIEAPVTAREVTLFIEANKAVQG